MSATVPRKRKGTCDGCGRRRILTYPPRKNTKETPRILKPGDEIYYYGLCSECFPRVNTQADIAALRKEHAPARRAKAKQRSRLAYPCIGGPLDGLHATTEDWQTGYGEPGDRFHQEEGLYAHLRSEYVEYNGSGAGRKRIGGFPPTMIYVHRGLLKPLVSGRDR